jgi:hypothetical protein
MHQRNTRSFEGNFVVIAAWTDDIALVLSGLVGFLHWHWWFPVLFGAIAAAFRDASQGLALINSALWFRLPHSIHNNDLSTLLNGCHGGLHPFDSLGRDADRFRLTAG